jgi:hypothetical protein
MRFSIRAMLAGLFADEADLAALMRNGLDGLTDPEYLWEPVDGCWSVRPRSEQRTGPDSYRPQGDWGLDIEYPDPKPSPFTTIAWRMTHLTSSMYTAAAVLRGRRLATGHLDERYAGNLAVAKTAGDATARWYGALRTVQTGIRDIAEVDLWREESHEWDRPPARPGTGLPVWRQVLYFGYFETASHAAEVRLIRDLYRHTSGGHTPLRPAT